MKVNSSLMIACAVLLGFAFFLISRRMLLTKTELARVESHREKIPAEPPGRPLLVPSAPTPVKEEPSRPSAQANTGNSVQKPSVETPVLQTNPPPLPTPKKSAASTRSTPRQKEELKDPVARIALVFVGADPEAEAYWMAAINDPSLSAHERGDLIEDLNEDGLSDPKHPAEEDLPLIINRLALIEELVPDAMDQVNADAFAEAYKDLVNLVQVALGGGEPVR